MNSIRLLVLLIFLLPLSVSAQKYDKHIRKADRDLEKGKYAKASKRADKLEKKTLKKLGANNKYLPYVSYIKTENALQLGDWHLFENNIAQMLDRSATIHIDRNEQLATSINAIRQYSEAGQYRFAYNYLDSVFGSGNQENLSDELFAKKTAYEVFLLSKRSL